MVKAVEVIHFWHRLRDHRKLTYLASICHAIVSTPSRTGDWSNTSISVIFLSSQEKIRGTMKNKADWWQWTWNDLNKDCDSKLTNLRLADYRMYSTPEADREEEEEDAEARAKQARCRTGNIHSRAIQAVWMSLGSAWGHAWDDCHQELCRCQWCLYLSIELSAIVQFQTELGRGIAVCKCGCQT